MSAVVALQHILLAMGSLVMVLAALASWWQRTRPFSARVLGTGLAAVSLGMVIRWGITGHPPMFGTFENSLSAAWFVGAAVLALGLPTFEGRVPELFPRAFGLWTIPLLAAGQFADRTPYPLTISERSLVVDTHVLFAWAAQTVLLAAATAAIVVLARRVEDDRGFWADLMFRGAGVGFALFTTMIVLGSIYSYLLFAEWYRWEIVEAFAAAAWIAYGACLHAAMFFGWKDRRLAIALLVASVLMLGTFWVWGFWGNTYHHFEIPAIKAE